MMSIAEAAAAGLQYKFDVERARPRMNLVIARDSAGVLVESVLGAVMAGAEVASSMIDRASFGW